MIKRLPRGKAPGPDRISAEMLHFGGDGALHLTTRLIQMMWHQQEVPTELSEALIFLIPKDRTQIHDPAQQRPISLTNCLLRILDKLVYTRLKKHVEDNDVLSDNQAGFRAMHSCTHQIVVLEQIIQMEKQAGREVHG